MTRSFATYTHHHHPATHHHVSVAFLDGGLHLDVMRSGASAPRVRSERGCSGCSRFHDEGGPL
jgi:hypothetical protein